MHGWQEAAESNALGFFATEGAFWRDNRKNVLMLDPGCTPLLQLAHPLAARAGTSSARSASLANTAGPPGLDPRRDEAMTSLRAVLSYASAVVPPSLATHSWALSYEGEER